MNRNFCHFVNLHHRSNNKKGPEPFVLEQMTNRVGDPAPSLNQP